MNQQIIEALEAAAAALQLAAGRTDNTPYDQTVYENTLAMVQEALKIARGEVAT